MRTFKSALAIVASLSLAACALSTIKDKMPSYTGMPAKILFERLGYPTAEQNVAGSKAYIWTTNRFVEGTSYGCKIRVIVDAQDNITNWDFEGNEGGCGPYASRLR